MDMFCLIALKPKKYSPNLEKKKNPENPETRPGTMIVA